MAQFRVLTVLLLSLLLHACAPPTPAPVISREAGSQRHYSSYAPTISYAAPKISYGVPTTTRPGHYRIKRGDTIYSIAWRYGFDYREFASWNNIRYPYRIHAGQYLSIQRPATNSPTERVVKTEPAKNSRSQVVTVSNRKKTPKNRGIVKNESYQNLKLRWQWPTQGRVGAKFRRGDQTRKGVLLSGRLGQGIKAAEAGTVVYSGSGLVGYGKLVIIKHNKNYLSAYGHNRKLMVKEGDKVQKGTHIADMGKNGSGKTVLHFEIRRNGIPVDPLPLLPRRS
jgi:lipoprotein NlpD